MTMLRDSVLVRSGQLWKFNVGFAVLMLSFGAMVYGIQGGDVSWRIELAMGAPLVGLLAGGLTCYAIRCHACGMRWLWAAVRYQDHSTWVTWLL
ncbi:MAG TPA: hypothetical protein VI299_26170, partial [Polyangiales bacterium]